jgi:hypothetical protein
MNHFLGLQREKDEKRRRQARKDCMAFDDSDSGIA